MAAQYTEVTLEDMEKFLKRGFRALRPKQGVQFGEYYYDLGVTDYLFIRVWSSVRRGTGTGAGVGEDAIRVQLMSVQTRRPAVRGKAPIVKRTQGWRNSLQNKIEDTLEAVEEMDAKATGAPQQESVRDDNDGEAHADDRPDDEVEHHDEDAHDEGRTPPPSPRGPLLNGTFTQYRGEWMAKVKGNGSPGSRAILDTKGGRRVPVTLTQKMWSGNDRYGDGGYVEIWAIEPMERRASEDYSYDRRGVD